MIPIILLIIMSDNQSFEWIEYLFRCEKCRFGRFPTLYAYTIHCRDEHKMNEFYVSLSSIRSISIWLFHNHLKYLIGEIQVQRRDGKTNGRSENSSLSVSHFPSFDQRWKEWKCKSSSFYRTHLISFFSAGFWWWGKWRCKWIISGWFSFSFFFIVLSQSNRYYQWSFKWSE